MPTSIEATAEDTLTSVISFSSGAIGQWTQSYAAHGRGFGHKVIYGSQGSLLPGGTRNGISPVLSLDNQQDISGPALLPFVPDYHLDDITAHLFGEECPSSYTLPFQAADRKLLAIELYEFADSILKSAPVEVDGTIGRKAAAICYAAFESSTLNRPVTLEEIETEKVGAYEEEINAHLNI
jgi:predicted dehydrogenase